ncbi:DUF3332 domain-containing protein [Vibrio lamellibrachiae]|uniref:DUF3332 family protein n=1 Tax=Vibrio lamellibrachiae TaxID=2910253 RepID=UPI003D132B7B
MNRFVKPMIISASLVTLFGCVGSNAVTGKLMEFNVKAVDNRYARGGLNMLLAPAYGITVAADYIVFNSLEFWTGKNPINKKPHIFDSKVGTYIEINDQLDKSLTEAPLDPLAKRVIGHGEMKVIDENQIAIELTYDDGSRATLTGERFGDEVHYSLNNQVIAETSLKEMQVYLESIENS